MNVSNRVGWPSIDVHGGRNGQAEEIISWVMLSWRLISHRIPLLAVCDAVFDSSCDRLVGHRDQSGAFLKRLARFHW